MRSRISDQESDARIHRNTLGSERRFAKLFTKYARIFNLRLTRFFYDSETILRRPHTSCLSTHEHDGAAPEEGSTSTPGPLDGRGMLVRCQSYDFKTSGKPAQRSAVRAICEEQRLSIPTQAASFNRRRGLPNDPQAIVISVPPD